MKRDQEERISATPFELLTAVAFEIFTEKRVEVGVVEVGMGGRLDSTNIIADPLVSIITRIGLDHQAFLGNTIQEIAREKAGICKPGAPVLISDDNPQEVHQAVWDVANMVGAVPTVIRAPSRKDIQHIKIPRAEISFEETQSPHLMKDLIIPGLRGIPEGDLPQWKKNNMKLALAGTFVALKRLGRPAPVKETRRTFLRLLMKMRVRGRQELVSITSLTDRKNKVLLDGAHNAQAANELAKALSPLRVDNMPTVWLLAFSAGRDIDELLKIWLKPEDIVVCCEFGPVDGMPWVKPVPGKTIASQVKKLDAERTVVDCRRDVLRALKEATLHARGPNGKDETPIVIAGSLYLVSDVLRLLRDKLRADRRTKRATSAASKGSNNESSAELSDAPSDGLSQGESNLSDVSLGHAKESFAQDTSDDSQSVEEKDEQSEASKK